MEPELLRALDRIVAEKGYPSRSEAIRDLVRDALVREQWADPRKHVVGALTLVYDHHVPGLEETMTEVQHQYQDLIRCTTHVHLDERHCVEVVVLSGPSGRVREVANRLTALRGVRHAQLAATAVPLSPSAHDHSKAAHEAGHSHAGDQPHDHEGDAAHSHGDGR